MKKLLLAAAASLILFGGQAEVEASSVESLDTHVAETQELGKWSHFRDKYIRGRETENERRDRKEWERRHRDRDHYRDDYRRYPPPPPPPPPPPRHGSRYGSPPPPPPPRHR